METTSIASHPARLGYGPAPAQTPKLLVRNLSAARAKILEILREQSTQRTVQELSGLTNQHENTIREHLDALVAGDLVLRTRPAGNGLGRPAWVYTADTSSEDRGAKNEYVGLAVALAGLISRTSKNPRQDATYAGRSWGLTLMRATPKFKVAPSNVAKNRAKVVALLAELGFSPEADARFAKVNLTRCPLLEAANQFPDVVCAVHLGIVQGALKGLGARTEEIATITLSPFSHPGACQLNFLAKAPRNLENI